MLVNEQERLFGRAVESETSGSEHRLHQPLAPRSGPALAAHKGRRHGGRP